MYQKEKFKAEQVCLFFAVFDGDTKTVKSMLFFQCFIFLGSQSIQSGSHVEIDGKKTIISVFEEADNEINAHYLLDDDLHMLGITQLFDTATILGTQEEDSSVASITRQGMRAVIDRCKNDKRTTPSDDSNARKPQVQVKGKEEAQSNLRSSGRGAQAAQQKQARQLLELQQTEAAEKQVAAKKERYKAEAKKRRQLAASAKAPLARIKPGPEVAAKHKTAPCSRPKTKAARSKLFVVFLTED